MEILIPVIVFLALAVGGYVFINRRLNRRRKPEPPHAVGSGTGLAPTSDAEMDEEFPPPPLPSDATPFGIDEAEACKPGLTVNGVAGVAGAAYVNVPKGQLPSKLTIVAHDCPHENPEARTRAAHRLNFGGASSGYGSGELQVTLRRLGGISREFGRFGSTRVLLSSKMPTGEPDNRVFRVDEMGSWLVKVITKPSRRMTADSHIDTPIVVRLESRIRSEPEKAGDIYPVEVHVNLLPSDGSDQLAVVFREV